MKGQAALQKNFSFSYSHPSDSQAHRFCAPHRHSHTHTNITLPIVIMPHFFHSDLFKRDTFEGKEMAEEKGMGNITVSGLERLVCKHFSLITKNGK